MPFLAKNFQLFIRILNMYRELPYDNLGSCYLEITAYIVVFARKSSRIMPNLTKKQVRRSIVVWWWSDLHLQSHSIKNTRNVLEIAHLCEFGHKSSRIMPILASDLGEEPPYLEDSKYALNASIRSLQPKIFMKTFYVPDNNVELCQIWAKMSSPAGRFFSVVCPLSGNIWF